MNVFEKLLQLQEDFNTTWAAYNVARCDAADMIKAVAERMERDRRRNAERVADLRQIAADTSRSATVRRVAADELTQIEGREFFATPAEIEAFVDLIKQQRDALKDIRGINADIFDTAKAAEAKIKDIRLATRGHSSLQVVDHWLEGQKRDFQKLCKEAVWYD